MQTRRAFLYTAGASFAAERLRVTDTKGEKVTVAHNGTTVLEYRYSKERPKPYVHPLCLPDGRPVTLDGPKDHIHHRGLMAAWSEVNGFDFWGEDNPAPHGQIIHQKFERVRDSPPAEIVSVNHWVAEGRLLLIERCAIRIPVPTREGVWLEWVTELRPARDPVKLAAGKHVYNGLGIRVPREMDGGSVLNSNGTAAIDKANGEPATWCAYQGGDAGVAFFDSPKNPRHPNAFFVMNKPFGYMSAAPTFREPFDLGVGQSIRFTWGVLAYQGKADSAVLDRRYERWTQGGR
jgi:hypothetical protein